jgi:hypothetical protein
MGIAGHVEIVLPAGGVVTNQRCSKCSELLGDYNRAVDLFISAQDESSKEKARDLVIEARNAFSDHLSACTWSRG